MPTMTNVKIKADQNVIATAQQATYQTTGKDATVTLNFGYTGGPFSKLQTYTISGEDNGMQVPLGNMRFQQGSNPEVFVRVPRT